MNVNALDNKTYYTICITYYLMYMLRPIMCTTTTTKYEYTFAIIAVTGNGVIFLRITITCSYVIMNITLIRIGVKQRVEYGPDPW